MTDTTSAADDFAQFLGTQLEAKGSNRVVLDRDPAAEPAQQPAAEVPR